MTLNRYLEAIADVLVRDEPFLTVGDRGAGTVRLTTADDHAAHCYEMRAKRAGLRTLATTTDAGAYVVTVRGFMKENR